jgi:dCMP deaminase
MKPKFVPMYMEIAEIVSKQSSAKRLQVGAIVVKEDRIISIGYNGMPAGWTNVCEEVIEQHEDGGQVTRTKDEVIHAEANAIAKLAKGTESGDGSTMFITHAPCIHCAKQIYTAGVKKLYYRNTYRDTNGLEFLSKCGVDIEKIDYELGVK